MVDNYLNQAIEIWGIYAVFVLCTFEGDITLLTAGVMAHSSFFGQYSFLKVLVAGITGGVAGDSFGYMVGRVFRETVKNYKFYRMAQPRIERLIENYGGLAIVISKYIYGIRVAMVIFNGVGRMPFLRFLMLDTISCTIWAFLLAGVGYFFSGAVTSIIGDFKHVGYYLFAIVAVGVIGFYLIETFWLSKKVEHANPETIHKIEEKIHHLEEEIQEKLHLSTHSMKIDKEAEDEIREESKTEPAKDKKD